MYKTTGNKRPTQHCQSIFGTSIWTVDFQEQEQEQEQLKLRRVYE